VASPDVEIGVELAEVDIELRHCLGAVDEHHGTSLVGAPRDVLDRVDRPEHV
jgi:hypothetical protein